LKKGTQLNIWELNAVCRLLILFFQDGIQLLSRGTCCPCPYLTVVCPAWCLQMTVMCVGGGRGRLATEILINFFHPFLHVGMQVILWKPGELITNGFLMCTATHSSSLGVGWGLRTSISISIPSGHCYTSFLGSLLGHLVVINEEC
jgi:hypothetical protein